MRTRRHSWLALPAAGLLILAACGGDDDAADESEETDAPEEADDASTTAAADTVADDTAAADTAADDTAAADTAADDTGGDDTDASPVSLTDVCPDPITLLTDWNPESEHGFVYELIGDDYEINVDNVSVRGPLVDSDGNELGVDFEVRSGGPAIGFQTVTSQLYQDEDILLGYVYTDEAIQFASEMPTVAIESGMEKNPQIIMWDPDTYPDVETIEDLGEQDVLVRYFDGAAYMEYFVQSGILSRDQVDGSYDGTPGQFLAAEGADAQQGFGSAEPFKYEHEFAQWGKPVEYQYINDAGWENYAESIATRPENIEEYGECFAELVPLIQQASVDYVEDPAETNALILDAVETFDTGWTYSEEVAQYAVETMRRDGLMANGPDGAVGKFDMDRVEGLIENARPVYAELGQEPPEDLSAEDIVTNEFIDDSIGF